MAIPAQAKRTPGWESRLTETVARIQEEKFAWGTSDCLTRVSDVCEAMTGVDVLRGHRGYRSEKTAAAKLAKLGFSDVGEALASVLEEIPPAMARRGDVGVVVRGEVVAAVVVMGPLLIGAHPKGSFKVSSVHLRRAFRVG